MGANQSKICTYKNNLVFEYATTENAYILKSEHYTTNPKQKDLRVLSEGHSHRKLIS